MLRGRVLADLTAMLGGNPRGTEESRVLVHAEGLAPNGIGRQLLEADGSDEGKCRDDQRGYASDLIVAGRGGIVLQ